MPEEKLTPGPEGDGLENLRARIAGLKELLAEKEAALQERDDRLTQLEQAVAAKDSEVATLKQTSAELEAAKKRVLGLVLRYQPRRGEYEQRLSLGAV